MADYISVKVLAVRDLFSGAYVFRLPWFQRAYAWHTTEVGRLLTNVLDAMEQERLPRRYFLGKIVLAKADGSDETALVDGHQRVMTLTLLYAVLRDLETDEQQRQRLQSLIGAPRFHLQPQHAVSDFLRDFVQEPGATLRHPEDDFATLSETQRNIIDNRDHLHSELSLNVDAETRRRLAEFLADDCRVLKCAVDDENEAWRILQIEEDTRVEFTPADRAKSTLLSIMPSQQRSRSHAIWEHCEGLLGSADLHALLAHLRMLRMRNLSDKPVEADLARAFAMDEMGLAFVENELAPAAELVARLRAGTVGAPSQQAAIAACVRQMSWIDRNFWMPAALNWLSRRGETNAQTTAFFQHLERLVWFSRLSGADPVKRQRHILRLLGEMDKGEPLETIAELRIPKVMRSVALENLRSPTFDAKHYATRLLRRVSVALGQDPGPTHAARLTLEHILPRSFLPSSPWRQDFPQRKSVQGSAHRLGNLTFLSAADNQSADTLDWSAKRRILSASEFILSKRAGSTKVWTPSAISDRTEELIGILLKDWQLDL